MPLRFRKFYLELIGSTLLLALLPLLLISGFLIFSTQRAFEEEIVSANLSSLAQTVDSVELVKTQIDSSFRQLILDSTIASFESYPDGVELERASQSATYRNTATVAAYLETKNRVFNKINDLRLSNHFISSVYYYDAKKRIIMTDNWGQYEPLKFFDSRALRLIRDNGEANFVWIPRSAPQLYGPRRQVISVRLPSRVKDNAFVINLDARRVYDYLVRPDNEASTQTSVLTDTGEPALVTNDGRSPPIPAAFSIEQRTSEMGNNDTGSTLQADSLITYVRSPELNWYFVRTTDLGNLYRNVHSLRNSFFVAAGAALAMVIALSILASRLLYSPVNRLLTYLRNKPSISEPTMASLPAPSSRRNEFEYITATIEQTLNEQERLNLRLRESIPAFREKLIRTIIRPGVESQSVHQLRSWMTFAGIDLAMENVAVVTFALDETREKAADPREAGLQTLRLIDGVRSTLREISHGDVAQLEDGTLVAVVNETDSGRISIFKSAEAVQNLLTQQFETTATAGIGGSQPSIGTAYRSYRESIQALKHGLLGSRGDIVHIQDLRIGQRTRSNYLENRIDTLQDFVKSGEASFAAEVLEEIGEGLANKKRKAPYRQIQKLVTKVLISLVDSVEEMGADWLDICPDEEAPFERLASMRDIREIFVWYEELIQTLSDYFAQARSNRSWNYAQQVMNLLEKDCGKTVNLHSVAAQLDLNPSYLGRIFKDQVSMNFLDYLTKVRINRSKKLLVETDLTVQEIGHRVGYSNSYYFIRIFKQLTGTTPGRYKKHQSAPDA